MSLPLDRLGKVA